MRADLDDEADEECARGEEHDEDRCTGEPPAVAEPAGEAEHDRDGEQRKQYAGRQ